MVRSLLPQLSMVTPYGVTPHPASWFLLITSAWDCVLFLCDCASVWVSFLMTSTLANVVCGAQEKSLGICEMVSHQPPPPPFPTLLRPSSQQVVFTQHPGNPWMNRSGGLFQWHSGWWILYLYTHARSIPLSRGHRLIPALCSEVIAQTGSPGPIKEFI